MEVQINKPNYQKGEEITIIGTQAEGFVEITAKNGSMDVFNARVLPVDGNFLFERKIDYLDPKGIWRITVKDAKTASEKNVLVNPNREAEYLVITFKSPAPAAYARTTNIDVTVEVKDAQQPVLDALVYVWGLKGEKLQLQGKGDGSYSLPYALPVDGAIGEFSLTAVASAMTGAEKKDKVGGEMSLKLKVETSPVNIEILEPKADEIELGEKQILQLRLSYANNNPVKNAEITALAEHLNIIVDEKEDGIYEGTFVVEDSEAGVMELRVKASDAHSNKGELKKSIKLKSEVFFLLKENLTLYIFPIIFVGYILVLAGNEASYFLRRALLRRRKQQLLLMKRNLQKQYYQDRALDQATFERRNAEVDTELNEIRTKLEAIEAAYRPKLQAEGLGTSPQQQAQNPLG